MYIRKLNITRREKWMSYSVNNHLFETRNKLITEISSLTQSQLNCRPVINMWSIAQVCQHLVLVEQATLKAIAFGLKRIERTQVERKDVQLMLDRTKKFKAPAIVEPAVEPFEMESLIGLLNKSREKLMTVLSKIEDKTILEGKSFKHPALGELPLDQWIEQIYLHEQRHIEQIKEIKLLLKSGQ